ncbi:hypothetical protein [Adlercreutzia agrestimuris]|uniref:hypothetical protein n=1 Tax=Adlercreutzia agrestimuris TaxID=2941324 RepID=UPI002040638C|nr:hypothetical protein [Adlercreutzia agrestimuris]
MSENMFEKYAEQRNTDQERIKDHLEKKAGKQGSCKSLTKLTISISTEDKQKFKILSAKEGKSMSAMLHEWLETLDE